MENRLEEFEETLKPENIKENKSLLNFMDDNLTVHLEDYLENPVIVEKHNFTREQVLAALKSSDKFIYDPVNQTITPKIKPRRRIIVFRDIPKEHQTNEEVLKLFEKETKNKIEKIKSRDGLFYIYFFKEQDALEEFKKIEILREKNDKPFVFTAFVKVENLKRDLLGVNSEENLKYITNMILDISHYKPRSSIDTEQINNKHRFSKFDTFDPFLEAQEELNNLNFRKNSYNKYDKEIKKPKRNKAYSFHYQIYAQFNKKDKKSIHVPLNKEFSTFIQYRYEMKDITRVFINMNLMKKFASPPNFKGEEFLAPVMRTTPKINLEYFGKKKPLVQYRERAFTYNWSQTNRKDSQKENRKNHNKKTKKNSGLYNINDEYEDLRKV